MSSPHTPALDADMAHQAKPGHGIPSQDPNAGAQQPLSPDEAHREQKSVLVGGGALAGAATGAAAGAVVAGPAGVLVGGAIGAVAGTLGGAAAGAAIPAQPPAVDPATLADRPDAVHPHLPADGAAP